MFNGMSVYSSNTDWSCPFMVNLVNILVNTRMMEQPAWIIFTSTWNQMIFKILLIHCVHCIFLQRGKIISMCIIKISFSSPKRKYINELSSRNFTVWELSFAYVARAWYSTLLTRNDSFINFVGSFKKKVWTLSINNYMTVQNTEKILTIRKRGVRISSQLNVCHVMWSIKIPKVLLTA